MKIKTIISVIIGALLISSICYAENITQEALEALDTARADVEQMNKAGLPVTRATDTLMQAQQDFDAQFALEEKTGKADYTSIIEKTKDIGVMKDKAFYTHDELTALEIRINQSSANMTQAIILLEEAKREFGDERYDQASEIIDNAYEMVSELEARETAVRAFAEESGRTLRNFLEKNWKTISYIIILSAIALTIMHKRLSIFLIKRKIGMLETERDTLRELIKKAQYDYFTKRTMSESIYHIKLNKFSELIRDNDRQILVLKEQLALKQKKSAKKETVVDIREKRQEEER